MTDLLMVLLGAAVGLVIVMTLHWMQRQRRRR
jgi:hypothetical protein